MKHLRTIVGLCLLLSIAGCNKQDIVDSDQDRVNTKTVNHAPELEEIEPQITFSGLNKVIELHAHDQDGDPLSFTAISSSDEVLINIDGTKLTLTPMHEFYGISQISVEASDEDTSVSIQFSFEVLKASSPPIHSIKEKTQLAPPTPPFV